MSYDVTGAHALRPSGDSVGAPTRLMAHKASTSMSFFVARPSARRRGIHIPVTIKAAILAFRVFLRRPRHCRIFTMNYRRLGRSGLKVSELSFGSWVTYGNQLAESAARECMAAAFDAGVNFFDNAEVYAKGNAESIMGEALKRLGWRRSSYIVSTKFFWGLHDGPNERNTLNRKYLLQAIDGSLQRLQLDHVDLVFCHRPDPDTPIEETVFALHSIIEAGKASYWGTSEWSAADITAAWHIAERHHLHKPVTEQPQYNLLH